MHRSFLKAGSLTAAVVVSVVVVSVAACSTNLSGGFDPDDASTFGDQQAFDSALKDANGVHPDASLKDGTTKDAVADSRSIDANTGHDSSSIYDAGGSSDANALNACGICD